MATTHYLRFIVRGHRDDLIFEVRKSEIERLRSILGGDGVYREPRFFWFDSISGESVVINLQKVQAVRLLWEPVPAPPDVKVHNGSIRIQLVGRSDPLEENTAYPEQLYDLLTNLEHGPEVIPFPAFVDLDGEPIYLNAAEVVWVLAPKHVVDEGARIVAEESGAGNGSEAE